jgi:hypothetical protein
MDLGTVLQRLNNEKYSSLERWKEDVAQIWKNASLYNGEGTLMDLLARELSDIFRRYCETIPRTESELWQYRLRRSQAKLDQSIRARPMLIEAPTQTAAPAKPVKLRLKNVKK